MKQPWSKVLGTLLFTAVFAMTACQSSGSGSSAATAGPALGGTLVFGRGGDTSKLDPAVITDGESTRVTVQMYDTLVMFDKDTTNVVPGLAEKWSASADAKEWTFTIRKGAKFHDGSVVDAKAVKANFDRWMDKSVKDKSKVYEYWVNTTGLDDLVTAVAVPDDSTFKITLKEAQAPLVTNLALFALAIVNPVNLKDTDKLGTGADAKGAGSGAFKFVEWKPGDSITLEANKDYWGPKAKLDKLVFRVIKDNAARFLELKSGNIQGLEGVDPDNVTAAKADANLQVVLRPAMNVGYINFNQNVKPFDNAKIRQAVALAINRKAIVDSLYGGTGQVATQLLPPGLLGFNPDVKGPEYNVDKAKQALKDAGMPDGFSTDFWYMPVSRPYYPNPKSIAEAIQADLAKVGIKLTLKTEDWTQYLSDRNNLKFPVWMLGWTGDNGDPDNFLYTFFGNTTNDNSWANKDVQTKLKQGQTTADSKARDTIYRDVEKTIDAELPRIPIAHNTPALLFSKKVQGYVANPTATEFFNSVSLNK